MRLISSAFAEGQRIPTRFTCEGENISPPLQWSDPPPGTRSFILLCDDPDAPSGTWRHWAVYDIPAETRSLPEGFSSRTDTSGIGQGVGDARRMGYDGPCPPRGHGPHRYRFHLLALSIGRLPIRSQPSCKEVEREARTHVLAEAILMGVFERR